MCPWTIADYTNGLKEYKTFVSWVKSLRDNWTFGQLQAILKPQRLLVNSARDNFVPNYTSAIMPLDILELYQYLQVCEIVQEVLNTIRDHCTLGHSQLDSEKNYALRHFNPIK